MFTVSPAVIQIRNSINEHEKMSLVMADLVGSLIVPVLLLAIACRLAFSKSKKQSKASDLIDSGFDDQ